MAKTNVNKETKGGEHDATVFEAGTSKNLENIESKVSKVSTTICHDDDSVYTPIEISISKDIVKASSNNVNPPQITPFQDVSNTFDYKAVFEEHEDSEKWEESEHESESALDDICISDEDIESDNTRSIHFSENEIDLMSIIDEEDKYYDALKLNENENAARTSQEDKDRLLKVLDTLPNQIDANNKNNSLSMAMDVERAEMKEIDEALMTDQNPKTEKRRSSMWKKKKRKKMKMKVTKKKKKKVECKEEEEEQT